MNKYFPWVLLVVVLVVLVYFMSKKDTVEAFRRRRYGGRFRKPTESQIYRSKAMPNVKAQMVRQTRERALRVSYHKGHIDNEITKLRKLDVYNMFHNPNSFDDARRLSSAKNVAEYFGINRYLVREAMKNPNKFKAEFYDDGTNFMKQFFYNRMMDDYENWTNLPQPQKNTVTFTRYDALPMMLEAICCGTQKRFKKRDKPEYFINIPSGRFDGELLYP